MTIEDAERALIYGLSTVEPEKLAFWQYALYLTEYAKS